MVQAERLHFATVLYTIHPLRKMDRSLLVNILDLSDEDTCVRGFRSLIRGSVPLVSSISHMLSSCPCAHASVFLRLYLLYRTRACTHDTSLMTTYFMKH